MADYTTTTSMPDWAQPYAAGYLERAQQVADMPYQAYDGQTVAGFTPWQQQGYQAMAQRAMDGSPLMGSAQTALQGMWSNPGGDNPYLTDSINRAQGDVIRNWNTVQMPGFDTAMSRSGSFGNENIRSMAQQGASDLQRTLGDISSQMRGAAYESGQNRALQALGLAPAFAQSDYTDIGKLVEAGGAYQQQQQAGLDDTYKRFLEARGYPVQQLNVMGNALKNNFGNTTTQTAPDPSALATGLGGALTFAQLWNLLGGG